MIGAQFRPIEQWPGTLRPDDARKSCTFTASYAATLDLLERELDHLAAADIVIELALEYSDIRNDGWPRSNARPRHPGVIVSFGSMHGPLRYATDVFTDGWSRQNLPGWQANLRAIALGLEALRKVDRYGITQRGEQYTGWSALPPATPMGPASFGSAEDAARFVGAAAGWTTPPDPLDPYVVQVAYRAAAKRLHPDAGGDTEQFKRLQEAMEVLGGRP